jgi:Mn2+/Fe2+ NRAMP family transporter
VTSVPRTPVVEPSAAVHRPDDAQADRGQFRRVFGPGVLWAATAVGVSHLVQSTRAGADAGLALWWVILAALVLKYPFFEFGPRYAAATGRSLIEGYRRIGLWALWLYVGITIISAVIVQTAVVLFTAVLLRSAFGLGPSAMLGVSAGVLGVCIAILIAGRYRALDFAIKIVMAGLAVSTLIAALIVVPRIDGATLVPWPLAGAGAISFPFLLALVGWMPSGIDVAAWSSLWTLAKVRARRLDTRPISLRYVLLDFRIGYVGTGILAFAFLALGAGVMHGAGTSFSNSGPQFSAQLVDLYASAFGSWARPLVMAAAVTTMFSTALTVADGFPRAIARGVRVLSAGDAEAPRTEGSTYWVAIGLFATATLVILWRFSGNLTGMVDFATTASFLTAPVIGYLNLRAVTGTEVPAHARPTRAMITLAWTGLALLGATAVVYLAFR